jgi:phage-related minor tail protein
MSANSVTLRLGVEGDGLVEQRLRQIGQTAKKEFEAASQSVGLARYEVVNLSRQLQDVFVSLSSGQSPLTVLIQQGTQVADVLGSREGGLGGGIRALGASLRGVISPATAAGAAIAAAAGVAVASLARWQAAQDALALSLNGLGRTAGLTLSGANGVAERAAAASGLSISNAQALVGQYLAAGVPGQAIGGGVGLTRDFSRRLGVSQEDAAKTIAGALADPTKGAQELADKFGLLTRAQRLEILQTAALGDRSAAAQKLVDALRESIDNLREPTAKLGALSDKIGVKISNILTAAGQGIATGLDIVQTGRAPNSLGAEAGRAVAQADADRRAAQKSLDDAKDKLAPLANIAQDADLAAKAITATTYAEREAVVIEKARADALRDITNATKIYLEAEAERLRMLAEATARTQEYARSTERMVAGLGKTNFERQLQQIENERADLLRQVPSAAAAPRLAEPKPAPAAEAPRSEISKESADLVAEAVRRGLEPTVDTFEKLIAEGVGEKKPFVQKVGGPMPAGVDSGTGLADSAAAAADLRSSINASANKQRNAVIAKAQAAPLDQARDDLDAYNRALDAQAAAFGKSAGEAARLSKEQELLTQYTREHIPLTDESRAKIAALAEEWGQYIDRLDQVNRKNQELVQSLDQIRGTATGALSSFVGDLSRGVAAGDALKRVMDQLLQTVINIAAQKLVENLFGQSGSNGAGSLLGSLFSSASNSGGGILSSLASLFHFADGGIMTSAGPLPLRAYAGGGVANSPQLALYGEGSRPEAFVPLPDGRSIPVAMSGGWKEPKITFHNYAGVRVEPRITRDEIKIMIRDEQAQNNARLPAMLDAYRKSDA